ncbi:MAG: DUF692 domain-containing protein [Sulfuricellaceae bacterium]|nr:DUF692 domain-containing protein [Sulfuricellaceae bacterium]
MRRQQDDEQKIGRQVRGQEIRLGIELAGLRGVGLGLRSELIPALRSRIPDAIDFLEVAPENWIGLGGALGKELQRFREQRPIVAHGLSLSLGGLAPLDEVFLGRVKHFLDQYRAPLYSEHLSYCSDDGQLYDLLPIPFTEEAVHYVAARIRRTQDILERRIAVENASYYVAAPIAELSETDFIRAVLEEADCLLHLDVNNIYVNSVNFDFDPSEFLHALPGERIAYIHTAGHYREADDLLIDTHGAAVIEPVWALLEEAYRRFGVFPTLLERDFNIPPLEQLLPEVERIAQLQQCLEKSSHAAHA